MPTLDDLNAILKENEIEDVDCKVAFSNLFIRDLDSEIKSMLHIHNEMLQCDKLLSDPHFKRYMNVQGKIIKFYSTLANRK